jgi:hypothetical protein
VGFPNGSKVETTSMETTHRVYIDTHSNTFKSQKVSICVNRKKDDAETQAGY